MSDLGPTQLPPEEVNAAFSYCAEAEDSATLAGFRLWWKRRGFAGKVRMDAKQFAMCSQAVTAVRRRRA